MIERLAEGVQCCKTGEGRYNKGKFQEDSRQNAKLEVTRSRLSPGVLMKEFQQFAWVRLVGWGK